MTKFYYAGVEFDLTPAQWEVIKVADEIRSYHTWDDNLGIDLQAKLNGRWENVANVPHWSETLEEEIPF